MCRQGVNRPVPVVEDEHMARYTPGHHESVLRSHRWRTAENSAGYLLPHLRSGDAVLDVGCGPGSITVELAERVGAEGSVLGIDNAATAIEVARRDHGAAQHGNLRYETGDVTALDQPDDSFDVAHAHQVLQHLADPVAALREMARVVRPGGLVAVRDADYGAMTWHPDVAGLEEWRALYRRTARINGGEPDAGRRLLEWVRAAGFEEATASASAWCFATPEDRDWWGGLQADRIVSSAIAEQVLSSDIVDRDALQRMAGAWRAWAAADTGWFAVLHGEVLIRVPGA